MGGGGKGVNFNYSKKNNVCTNMVYQCDNKQIASCTPQLLEKPETFSKWLGYSLQRLTNNKSTFVPNLVPHLCGGFEFHQHPLGS